LEKKRGVSRRWGDTPRGKEEKEKSGKFPSCKFEKTLFWGGGGNSALGTLTPGGKGEGFNLLQLKLISSRNRIIKGGKGKEFLKKNRCHCSATKEMNGSSPGGRKGEEKTHNGGRISFLSGTIAGLNP